MIDSNKKAPKVRSGDQVNPVVGSIIKIGGLIVIAALAVVITLVLVELFKKDKKVENIYKDNEVHHVLVEDFKEVIKPIDLRDYTNIKDKDIREILLSEEYGENVYIYFYYESKLKDIDKEEKNLLINTKKDFPVLFINLDSPEYKDLFNSEAEENILEGSFIEVEEVVLNKDKYFSFIIEFNINELYGEENKPLVFHGSQKDTLIKNEFI